MIKIYQIFGNVLSWKHHTHLFWQVYKVHGILCFGEKSAIE